MALSQKHEGKSFVPWFCSAEWHYVFNKIYGNNSNDESQREALEILKVWKARTPLLPCGVEGTYIILEAIFLNRENYDNYNLKLLLSSAVMRFLNICAAYNKFQGTFYQTARKMRLPDWLINLRHDTAHGLNLPSFDVLNISIKYCFDWLYREYWKPYSSKTADFTDTTKNCNVTEFIENLEPLLANYCYVNLLLHPYWNYAVIDNIENEESKILLINELSYMSDENEINGDTTIKAVLNILWEQIEVVLEKYKEINNIFTSFVELLLNDDAFLASFDECDQIFDEIYPIQIPSSFTVVWEKMLRNMHKLGMLEALIKELLNILTKTTENHKRKWFAALWLAEIGNGLSKCILAKKIWKELKKQGSAEISERRLNKLLKDKCEKQSPEFKNTLNLSFLSPIPEILKDEDKLKIEILDNPNEYTHLFVANLLNVNGSFKSESTVKQIIELVKTYVTKEDDALEFSKIFTVEDINTTMEIDIENTEKNNTDDTETEIMQSDKNQNECTSKSIWRKVTDISFDKCPLGILPFQSSAMNPLL